MELKRLRDPDCLLVVLILVFDGWWLLVIFHDYIGVSALAHSGETISMAMAVITIVNLIVAVIMFMTMPLIVVIAMA